MRNVALVLSLAALVAMPAGCSRSPYDAGRALAEKHCANGINPSRSQQARMQAEVERETVSYSMEDKMEFLKGYMEGAMDEAMSAMQQEMRGGLPGAAGAPQVQHVRRSLPPPREFPQRQW